MRRTLVTLAAAWGLAGGALAQTGAPPKTWVDYTTLKADLRYRFERIEDESKLDSSGDTFVRNRDRIRARLSVEVKPNDRLKVGIGFSTGQADPVSGNQSLGDGLAKKDFRLDLGYFDYSLFGEVPHETHAIAGKMKNPFLVFPDDLVWDGDLTQEGLALRAQWMHGPVTLLAQGGHFWILERSNRTDAHLSGAQGAFRLQLVPEAVVTLGASWYRFRGMQGFDVIDWEKLNNSYGNSTTDGTVSGGTTNKAWATGFEPVVLFAQVDLWYAGLPFGLYAQSLDNREADDHESGQMMGASLGRAKNPGTFEVGYSYVKLEMDATPGLFTDSDRWGGGTDGKGHKIYGRYQLLKGLQAGVTWFVDERKIADSSKTKDYRRLQVDFVAAL